MDIKKLEYLKEFKKFNKIKYIIVKVLYLDNFIPSRSLLLGIYDLLFYIIIPETSLEKFNN
jgi:hypothetical protein